MKAALDGLARVLRVILTVLIALLIVPVSLQIFSRYLGIIPRYIWTEEIARFCFVWIVMIGAMIAVREGTHFQVDLLPQFKPKLEAALKIFVHLAMLVFALVFIIVGWDFAKLGARQTSEIAGLPLLAIFIAWPLTGVVWTLFLGEKLIQNINLLRHRIGGDVPR